MAAQLLSAQQQKAEQRRQLKEHMLMQRAARLGGDTSMAQVKSSLRGINGQGAEYAPAVLGLLRGGGDDAQPKGSDVSRSLGGGFSSAGQGASGAFIDSSDPYSQPIMSDTLGGYKKGELDDPDSGWFW